MRLVNQIKPAFWKTVLSKMWSNFTFTHHSSSELLQKARAFINITVERLSLITKLAKHFIENPILPFDKSRSIAHLIDSSHLIFRTSLSMLLLLLLFSLSFFFLFFFFFLRLITYLISKNPLALLHIGW